tara:strand:- start:63 stop:224 length:162 start_codon:yes stop_codon:yes gene_type:complete
MRLFLLSGVVADILTNPDNIAINKVTKKHQARKRFRKVRLVKEKKNNSNRYNR